MRTPGGGGTQPFHLVMLDRCVYPDRRVCIFIRDGTAETRIVQLCSWPTMLVGLTVWPCNGVPIQTLRGAENDLACNGSHSVAVVPIATACQQTTTPSDVDESIHYVWLAEAPTLVSVLSGPMGQPDSEVGNVLGGAPQCLMGGGVRDNGVRLLVLRLRLAVWASAQVSDRLNTTVVLNVGRFCRHSSVSVNRLVLSASRRVVVVVMSRQRLRLALVASALPGSDRQRAEISPVMSVPRRVEQQSSSIPVCKMPIPLFYDKCTQRLRLAILASALRELVVDSP